MSIMTSDAADEPKPWSYERTVVVVVVAMILVRLAVAANMPLASDEVLYWRYSEYLAPGYLDHPAMNPFLIRLGTTLFGDTSFGIRVCAVLTAAPASWAVWRAAAELSKSERIGASAALFFNFTVTLSVGSLLATSDASVVAVSAFVLYFLVRVDEGGHGAWWLAVGAAIGAGMWAKYTTAFAAIGIFIWLIVAPTQRRWFRSPWPYLGAVLSLLIFAPVILWNADHEWASVVYQSSRLVTQRPNLAYPIEFITSQIGLATPPIFALAVLGILWARGAPAYSSAAALLASLIAPVLIYFLWHSLHERVQGNWAECTTAAIVCAAALAVHLSPSRRGAQAVTARWSRELAAPIGAITAALIYAQALFGIIPLGRGDPTSRLLGVGWPELAQRIDDMRERAHAGVILTTDYTLASALAYFLPSHTPAEQVNERIRWSNEPQPPQALFDQQMAYVCRWPCPYARQLRNRFSEVQFLGSAARIRGSLEIERYSVYRVSGQRHSALDPVYPIRTEASGPYVL